jgi:nickel-dependent lactate racemase
VRPRRGNPARAYIRQVLSLPYGSRPYRLEVQAQVLELAALPPPPPVRDLLSAALRAPVGAPALRDHRPRRVTVIVSDTTRDEPRDEMVDAVLAELAAPAHVTLAIATGTHGPCGLALARRFDAVVDHDGHRDAELVMLGTTPRGTPVRVHRCVLETDLVIATGCIRPHYFAGFGAGTKSIFPGLGAAHDIRINHLLKTEPGARAGVVAGNPCRADMEDAAALVPTPVFLVNGVCGPAGEVRAVVAGDPRLAFRAGADLARPWFTVPAVTAPTVIASDALPVTGSLYQASKLAAAVAPLVEPGGMLVLVAECADGIGPIEVVNRAIYEIGIRPRLAPGVRVVLVSALDRATVAPSYATWAARVEDVIEPGRVLVVPRASHLIVGPSA